MLKLRQVIFGFAAASAIALLPMAPAMAGGHGFRPLNPFGLGRGVVGAAVALATLPLVIASAVVSGAQSVAQYPAYAGAANGYAPPQGYAPQGYAPQGYAPQVSYAGPQPYYAAYPGYYAAPRGYYGPRPYYAGHAGNYGHGYYRAGGNSYPHR